MVRKCLFLGFRALRIEFLCFADSNGSRKWSSVPSSLLLVFALQSLVLYGGRRPSSFPENTDESVISIFSSHVPLNRYWRVALCTCKQTGRRTPCFTKDQARLFFVLFLVISMHKTMQVLNYNVIITDNHITSVLVTAKLETLVVVNPDSSHLFKFAWDLSEILQNFNFHGRHPKPEPMHPEPGPSSQWPLSIGPSSQWPLSTPGTGTKQPKPLSTPGTRAQQPMTSQHTWN